MVYKEQFCSNNQAEKSFKTSLQDEKDEWNYPAYPISHCLPMDWR